MRHFKQFIRTVYCGGILFALTASYSSVQAAGTVDCSGADPSQYTIQGACPAKPIPKIQTTQESFFGDDFNDATHVTLPHKEDPTMPASCMVDSETNSFRSRRSVTLGEINDANCMMQEVADRPNEEECAPGERCKGIDDIIKAGNNKCLIHMEHGLGNGAAAAATSANPLSPGRQVMYNASAEDICEQQSTVPGPPLPYADKGGPTVVVDGSLYTMPDDETQLAYIYDSFDYALDGDAGFMDAMAAPMSADEIMNMMGLKMPFVYAGQFNRQAAKQFSPSVDGFLGSVQSSIMSMLSSQISGIRSAVTSEISNLTSSISNLNSGIATISNASLRTSMQAQSKNLTDRVNDIKALTSIKQMGDITKIRSESMKLRSEVSDLASLASNAGVDSSVIQKLTPVMDGLDKIQQVSDIAKASKGMNVSSLTSMLTGMLNSQIGGFGFQIRSDIKDHLGNKIGPSLFKSQNGFSPKHAYDRAIKAFAVRNVPAYATYDPADYKPGQEKRMALALAEKTPLEVAQAKKLNPSLVKESYAGIGGSGNMVETLLPKVHDVVSNDKVSKFITGGEMSLQSLNLNLTPTTKNLLEGSVSDLIKPMTTIQELKFTNFLQIFNATDMFAPLASLRLFPERDHYSPCISKSSCNVTKDYKPWPNGISGWHTNYHFSARDAVRGSGTLQNVIPVNILSNREREFTPQILGRMGYNRWCAGDPAGCCIGCTCPPKPCPPWVPCWSSACWGAPIGPESPPCATRHDPVHDRGQQLGFCDHPLVKAKLSGWAAANGVKLDLGVKFKRAQEMFQDIAKPIPALNKIPFGDGRKLADAGMQAMEGTVYRAAHGNSRPYIALDTTGKEFGQTGLKPNLFSDRGADIVFMDEGVNNTVMASNIPSIDGNQLAYALPDENSEKDSDFMKSAFAAAGGAGGCSGACLGGLGGKTGDGCGPDGAHPFASTVELTAQQRRTKQWFHQSCLPKYEVTFNALSPAVMAARADSAVIQRIIDEDLPLKDEGVKTSAPGSKIRTMSMTGPFRGHVVPTPAGVKAFPYGGGCKAPKINKGLAALSKVLQNNEQGNCVILLPRGGAKPSENKGFPNIAIATQGSTSDGKPYVDVVMSGIGTLRDRAGVPGDAGTTYNRRFWTELPVTTQKEMDEIISSASGTAISESCAYAWKECIPPSDVSWFCLSEEENRCK